MKTYDVCIITAATDSQAEGYRKQLEWRRSRNMLPEETEFLVYADPYGKRIGSGGSTIYVLYKLLERSDWNFDRAFRNKRMLILHSGGDSRRLPAYSAIGKVFAPLPTERFFALFDVQLNNLMQLPRLADGQVIVASGDVLLSFEPHCVAFSHTGVTGVAYSGSPTVASGHGVYVTSPGNLEGNPKKVINFLQKPSLCELQAANALDLAYRAFVDTGMMNFAIDAIEELISLSELHERIVSGNIQLDLYKEIAFAMLGKEDIPCAGQLKEIPFFVSLLPHCGFFHIGKSRKFLQNFYTLTHASALYDFRNFTRSNVQGYPQFKDAFVYNTFINTYHLEIEEPALIEGCYLDGKLKLEGENILTGVPEGAGDIVLKRGICLTVVPVKEGNWVSIIYGINDNFKRSIEDDEYTFMNISFSEWVKKHNVSPANLYDSGLQAADDGHLWNARLFPVSGNPAKAIQMSLVLQNNSRSIDLWKASRRMSLKDILQSADHERIMERYLCLIGKLSS